MRRLESIHRPPPLVRSWIFLLHFLSSLPHFQNIMLRLTSPAVRKSVRTVVPTLHSPLLPSQSFYPRLQPQQASRMSFHFASSEYAGCFQDVPTPDIPKIRQSAIDYLDRFNPQSWYDEPVSPSTIRYKGDICTDKKVADFFLIFFKRLCHC